MLRFVFSYTKNCYMGRVLEFFKERKGGKAKERRYTEFSFKKPFRDDWEGEVKKIIPDSEHNCKMLAFLPFLSNLRS